MRQLVPSFVILLISSWNISINSQDDYYWSGNQKNTLRKDFSILMCEVEEYQKLGQIKEVLNKKGVLLDSLISSYKSFLVYKVLYPNDNFDSFEAIRNELEALKMDNTFIAPGLINKSDTVFLTTEILLKISENSNIDNIIDLTGNPDYELTNLLKDNYILRLKDINNVIPLANKIYESKTVDYCHPNFVIKIHYHSDPYYTDQYYLKNTGQTGGTSGIDINVEKAWCWDQYTNEIIIAVIDLGINDHEDLNGRLLSGYNATNGYLNGTGELYTYHGQACGGIIAANHDNEIGIKGVANSSNIKLKSVVISVGSALATLQYSETAINWAVNDGEVDVLSCSWAVNDGSGLFMIT